MRYVFARVTFLVLLVALLLAPAATGAVPPPGQTPDAQRAVQRGASLLQQGQAEEALKELDKAIEEAPAYAMAHYVRGFALGQLGREQEAQQAFLEAALYNPGWTEAHSQAAIASFRLGDYDTCWEQTIMAHQAGMDMSAEIVDLSNASPPPGDLEARLNAPRVFVEDPDMQALEESRADQQTITYSAQYLAEMTRQARHGIQDSHHFGLVPRPDMADYILVIEVEDLGGEAFAEIQDWRRGENEQATPLQQGGNQPIELQAYLKLMAGEEQVYRRQMQIRNIRANSEINAELARQIGYLESWLDENRMP